MTQKTKIGVLALLCVLVLGLVLTPIAAQEDIAMLVRDGAYQVGVQMMTLTDESREDRTSETYVWYPALVSDDAPRPYPPDGSGAPYPLVIFSHGGGGSALDGVTLFINHLVSHGFVVAGVDHQDGPDLASGIIERPLDVLFLLNQLADLEDNDLVGLMDTEHVGVIGISFGGYTSLAVGGARIHPGYFFDWCASDTGEALTFYCSLLIPTWDEISARHDPLLSPSDEDLWSATTDERIVAILPMIPCLGRLFGDESLAAVTVPALIIAGTDDPQCPLDIESGYMYEHLGSSDRYLVSVNSPGHNEALKEDVVRHYAAAFFGYYLQEKADYAQYLTPESAEAFEKVTLEAQLGE